jgi:anti-sigma regulatory factor (Ser/Thr protein kinase)
MVASAPFDATPETVCLVRDFVAEAAAGSWDGDVDVAVLLASEIATNAGLHAEGGYKVTVVAGPECLRVEVRDASHRVPVAEQNRREGPGGLGLVIVERLASRWGLDTHEDGKTVWFELDSAFHESRVGADS